MQLQHKWRKHHKYLLASVDVKNPQANFKDLGNSVPLEESKDAKKVKEARQLEM